MKWSVYLRVLRLYKQSNESLLKYIVILALGNLWIYSFAYKQNINKKNQEWFIEKKLRNNFKNLLI